MINNLKTIDQSGIKALLRERFENPEKYANTPLIIWRSDIGDGIQQRILQEVRDAYNETLPQKEQKSFTITIDSDLERAVSETNGIVVLDPAGAVLQWKLYPETLKDFQTLLNNPGRLSEKAAPVVAYMTHYSEWFETPEVYTNAEQYLFVPDFDEWAEWAVREGEFPEEIIDFIRENGENQSIMYRWYNFFNVDSSVQTGRPGVAFPECWERILITLKNEAEDEELSSIFDLTEEQIREAIQLHANISDDVKEAFCKNIPKHKEK